MSRFFTLDAKKPQPNRTFLFLTNGKLYFGERSKYEDFIPEYDDDFDDRNVNSYYYKLYFNNRIPMICSEKELLAASAMGQRLIDGWFYYPSTKNIYTTPDGTMKCEISKDQTPMGIDGDGLKGFADYWKRKSGTSLTETKQHVDKDCPNEIV